MPNDEPSAEVIARLKEKHPDRALHLVSMTHCEQTHHFVMSGANHYEFKKFQDEVLDAGEKAKNKADENERLHLACKTAALAQIRWPDRDEVEKIFMDNPGIVHLFSKEIQDHAGSSAEVRSKKLLSTFDDAVKSKYLDSAARCLRAALRGDGEGADQLTIDEEAGFLLLAQFIRSSINK